MTTGLEGTTARPVGLPLGEGVGRQVDYWLTVYRRTWRGTVISSFVTPLLYVLSIGLGIRP